MNDTFLSDQAAGIETNLSYWLAAGKTFILHAVHQIINSSNIPFCQQQSRED